MAKVERGRLLYEVLSGIRIYTEGPSGRRQYRFLCECCGYRGTNNGCATTHRCQQMVKP
jgi:hypothetical protein